MSPTSTPHPSRSSSNSETFASESCSNRTSTATASAFVNSPLSASANVPESDALARSGVFETYQLLVTGGSGPGTYMLLANGNLNVLKTDQADFQVLFGGAELVQGSNGSLISSLFGGFIYGVPQFVNLHVEVGVSYFPTFAGRTASASAQFNGIEVVTGSVNPVLVANAVVSITQLPEPSLAWAVGLGLLGFVGWRSRHLFRHNPSLAQQQAPDHRASRS